MNTFLITFEINFPSTPIQESILSDAIKSYGSWARPTSKVWLIKTFSTQGMVMKALMSKVGPNDRILIMAVDSRWIARNLSNEVVTWMKSGM
jgi:hypothetical protein